MSQHENELVLEEPSTVFETPLVSVKQQYVLNDFEGPLDVLLYLIKKNEINIYDIPIGEITEQFLAYLDYAVATDLQKLTDFYAMAADLIYIKSRMLLPVEITFDEDELEDPRQELVDKLIEYQKIKKLSDLMEEKEEEAEWSFERKKIQRTLPFEEEELWEKMDSWALLKIFTSIIASYQSETILDMREEISLNEKIALMHELFEVKGECFFTDLLTRKGSMLDVVCAFMAILEAVKFKMVIIYQNKMYADIKIKLAKNE